MLYSLKQQLERRHQNVTLTLINRVATANAFGA
jgi:hypothetical protein